MTYACNGAQGASGATATYYSKSNSTSVDGLSSTGALTVNCIRRLRDQWRMLHHPIDTSFASQSAPLLYSGTDEPLGWQVDVYNSDISTDTATVYVVCVHP